MNNIYIVIDTETTGFSAINNELIEVSAIKYNGEEKIDTFSTLIKPNGSIPYHITKITGISNDMVEDAPRANEVMGDLIKFVDDYTIVAHNADFDMRFLKANTDNAFINNKVVDTVQISKILHPELANHKLATVAKHIGVVEGGYHRAEFDCECCAKIYMKYLKNN